MSLGKAHQLLEICESDELTNLAERVLVGLHLNEAQRDEAIQFHHSVLHDLRKLSITFISCIEGIDDCEIIDYCSDQFEEQVGYFWIELQSEWIRNSNLANFKLALNGEDDQLIQAKAAICSFFLEPLARLVRRDLVESSFAFLTGLLERVYLKDIDAT